MEEQPECSPGGSLRKRSADAAAGESPMAAEFQVYIDDDVVRPCSICQVLHLTSLDRYHTCMSHSLTVWWPPLKGLACWCRSRRSRHPAHHAACGNAQTLHLLRQTLKIIHKRPCQLACQKGRPRIHLSVALLLPAGQPCLTALRRRCSRQLQMMARVQQSAWHKQSSASQTLRAAAAPSDVVLGANPWLSGTWLGILAFQSTMRLHSAQHLAVAPLPAQRADHCLDMSLLFGDHFHCQAAASMYAKHVQIRDASGFAGLMRTTSQSSTSMHTQCPFLLTTDHLKLSAGPERPCSQWMQHVRRPPNSLHRTQHC